MMGENLIIWYRDKMKREWKIAFFSAFLVCLLVHIYKFTNTLPNHDSVYNIYSTQNITGSGRWFLQYVCGISSYFDLPWLNGLLSAVYLGLTAVIVTELLDIKNPVVIILSSAILAASPSTTETVFFGYTVDGYMLGLTMGALAALLSCKNPSVRKSVFSAVLLSLTCAVYQAYLSFAILLCAAYLVLHLMNPDFTVKKAWGWIGRHVVIYTAALASYYVVWKIALRAMDVQAVGYQGIDQVGHIGISTLVHGAIDSVSNLFYFLFEWNIFKFPISTYAAINVIFVLCFIGILVAALKKSNAGKEFGRLATILLVLLACVPMISIWEFTSDTVFYRPMMLHSVSVFYILALILCNRWVKPKFSTIFGLLTAAMVFNFAVMANISYFYLDKSYERSYYIASEIMEEIEELTLPEGGKVIKIAFIGDRGQETRLDNKYPSNQNFMMSKLLESDIISNGEHAYRFMENLFGLNLPEVTSQEQKQLEKNPQVQNLPTWPNRDCVAVIDDTVVVRLGK